VQPKIVPRTGGIILPTLNGGMIPGTITDGISTTEIYLITNGENTKPGNITGKHGIKTMEKRILIFSHNFIKFNWHPIVLDQLNILRSCGLYEKAHKIYYACYAEDEKDLAKFIDLVRSNDPELKIEIVVHPMNDNERQTLILLQQVVSSYDEEVLVLYSHTKGVSSLSIHHEMNLVQKDVDSWRKAMEYYTKERWQNCVDNLEIHDCVGCFYDVWVSPYASLRYYSGNFWWSKSSHIKRLPDMKKNPDNWMGCETFVTQPEDGKYCSLYNVQGGMYNRYFDPKDYRDDI
jgi:hypothetical protein